MTIQLPEPIDRPTILFIHGLGCDATHYQAAFQHFLLREYQICVPDLPGYGGNAAVEKPFTLEEIANEFRRRLKNILRAPLVLVGHSMGGALAQLILREPLERVAGFINVEGNLIGADCTFSRKAASVPYAQFVRERLPALLRMYRQHPYGESVQHANPRVFYQHSADLVRLSDSEELLHQFLAMDIPRIYVYGSENKHHPVLPRLQGIPKLEISRSGHFPMLDNPDEFYTAVAFAAGGFFQTMAN